MPMDIRRLANASIQSLTPYVAGKPTEELARELGIASSIKLASNENPLGMSARVKQALINAFEEAHIYPDANYYELKNALSTFLNISPLQMTVGNGSENVLELLIKTFLNPTVNVVVSQYAFLTIPILLSGYGIPMKTVPASQYGHDVDEMIKAIDDNTRMVFLVNPNNPTGTYTNKTVFERLLVALPETVLLVVDEAYYEYMVAEDYPNTLSYLSRYPNLIIVRTFSKVYGLAGLRIGYVLSSHIIADMLNRARLPFNVNAIAAKAATYALQDQLHVKESISLNCIGKKQLEKGLNALSIPFISSVCNFITIKMHDAQNVYNDLLHAGVIVRPLAAYGLENHLRISIGKENENERFLNALMPIHEKYA